MATFQHPCATGLTRSCFDEYPAFARRAFAMRLLSLFSPPPISRRLQRLLGKLFFDPSGALPPEIQLPPWWVILPGAVIDFAWRPGDPVPPGVWAPPDFFSKYPKGAVLGPEYLSPFSGGPPGVRPGQISAPVEPWFYDAFNTLDLTVWEKYLDGAATIAVSSGLCVWTSTGVDYCILRTAADSTIPDKWVFSIRLNIVSHAGAAPDFFIVIYSGSHAVKLRFNPPTTVWHATGAGSTEITVSNYVNQWNVWKLYYDDGYTDLWQGSTLLDSDQHHQHSTATKGRIELNNDNEITSKCDYVSVLPN